LSSRGSIWRRRRAEIVAASGGVARALAALLREGLPTRALTCGSLYLTGKMLKMDE
jgi:hypothetical protein